MDNISNTKRATIADSGPSPCSHEGPRMYRLRISMQTVFQELLPCFILLWIPQR